MSVSVTRLIPLSQDCCQVISTFTAFVCGTNCISYNSWIVFVSLHQQYFWDFLPTHPTNTCSLYDCQWHCHAHSLLRNTNIVQKKNSSTQSMSSLWKGTEEIFMLVACFKSHVSWPWSLCQQWTCGWEFYGCSKDIRSFGCRANCL